MWNKRKEEESPARPSQTPAPSFTPPAREQHSGSSYSTRSLDPPAPSPAGQATIGKAVMIKGQIVSREDLLIDGEIEGTVEAHDHRVTIGPNGKVQAGVKAREIIILGGINGNVEATEKIDIRKDAKLVGDIKTARIVIEDGAFFKGSIDITKGPEARKTTSAAPAAATPQPAATAATGGSKES
jgi:cytoskeletal protein CcmA (bactofilin family)